MTPPSQESYIEQSFWQIYDGELRAPIFGFGLCECGCGEKTPLIKKTAKRFGYIKGQPHRYIHGHHARRLDPCFLVRDCGYATPCWIWLGAQTKEGYGRGYDGARHMAAHRLYYEVIRKVKVPVELVVDHLCKNHICVNPDHLEPVTGCINVHRGDSCTLSLETVRGIIEMRKTGAIYDDIASAFNVTERHAKAICYGEHWMDDVDVSELPPKRTNLDRAVANQIAEVYKTGKSPGEIAAQFGIKRHIVYQIAQRRGLAVKRAKTQRTNQGASTVSNAASNGLTVQFTAPQSGQQINATD